jgi:threonine/homoserine/homoserine lactone efflux protein
MTNYLVIGISYAFASVVQPGPFQAFLLSQSLTNGWRKTIPMVFAPLLSDGPVVILVLFVLTNVPHELLRILQCAGGVLLLYLAFGAYRTWSTFDQRKEQVVSGQQNVLKAAMVNLLNPAPYLGWSLVMGPLLLKGWQESPANGMALVIGFYGTMILSSMGMVVLFAAARKLGPQVSRISIGISVIALAILGIYQVWSGIVAQ